MKRIAAATANGVLVLGAASACGTTTGSASSSSSTGTTPSGWQRVTAPRAGLSFAVPGDWIPLSGSKVNTSSPAFKKVSAAIHLTPAQLRSLFRQIEVIAFGPTVTHGFEENVDASLTGATDLPTEAALRAEFPRLHLGLTGVRDISTPIGTARVVTYSMPATHSYGAEIYVLDNQGVAALAFSASSPTEADTIMTEIVPTLQQTD